SVRPSRIEGRILVEDAAHAIRQAAGASTTASGSDVLITGATGFLGARVLHGLLARDDDRSIVCLVRAASEAEGLDRIRVALTRQGLVLDHARRVHIVLGDVRRARFGLDEAS